MSAYRKLGGILGSRVIGSAFQFGTLLLIARRSSILEFGNYSTVLAQGAIMGAVAVGGLPNMALRTSLVEQPPLGRTMFAITGVGAALTGLGVLVAGWLLLRPPGWWLPAAAVFIVAELMHTLVQNMLLAALKHRAAELVTIVRRAVPFVAVVASLPAGNSVFLFFMIGNLVSLGAAFLFSPVPMAFAAEVRRVAAAARPYWIASVGAMFQQLDLTIINLTLGASAAGSYGAAFRLSSPVHVVTLSLVGLMVPALVSDRSRGFSGSGGNYLRIGVSYALLLAFLSPAMYWVGPWVLGSQYGSHALLFPVLFINGAFSVVNQMLSGVLVAANEAVLVSRATVSSTLVGLLAVAGFALGGSLIGVGFSVVLIQAILLLQLGFGIKYLRIRGERQ